MYADPAAGPIMEPVSFERNAHAFMQTRKRIQKWLALTSTKHKQGKRYNMTNEWNSPRTFDVEILWRSEKKKRNEKVGKFRTQYSGPYLIAEIDEQRPKYRLDREQVAPVSLWVPRF